MTGIGNQNLIAYVEVNIKKPYPLVSYYEEKTNFLGRITREEGFYKENLFGDITLLDKIPSDMLVNGKLAFEKPHIIIEYCNGRNKKIHFNTEKEMKTYITRQFQGNNWIKFD